MRAIILAAGRGQRMGALTSDAPKGLMPLGGVPLVAWQLAALRAAGVSEVAVVTGYAAEALEPWGDLRFHNARWAETNMVVSLSAAAPWLEAGPCIVSYSDIVYDADAVRAVLGATGDLVVAFHTGWRALWERRFADPLADAESFRRAADGRLLEIGARAASLDEIEGQYMGLVGFTPRGWARVAELLGGLDPAARDRLDMTGLLRRLLAAGVRVETAAVSSPWVEVDSADDLALYERALTDGSVPLPARPA